MLPSLVWAAIEATNFEIRPGLQGWEPREFDGFTSYRVDKNELRATCKDAASALVFEREVDLEKTPVLTWSWKVENVFEEIDERQKAGDDYPARIYVIKKQGLFGMGTLALNYVWSSNQRVGAEWESAYTDQAQMRALDAGGAQIGVWRTHRRNVRRDFERLFGEDVDEIDGIAIMTDCDDSGQSARAAYRDISFVPEK